MDFDTFEQDVPAGTIPVEKHGGRYLVPVADLNQKAQLYADVTGRIELDKARETNRLPHQGIKERQRRQRRLAKLLNME